MIKTTLFNLARFSTNNLAFQSFKDPSLRKQISANISQPETIQKLDALTNTIFSLSNIQIQYLQVLQNQVTLKNGDKISDVNMVGLEEDKPTTIQYLYQKRWLQEVWKDYHIMTSLFSDEGDKEGVIEVVETVKQIYEFELTSVDPAQKIKIIKIIRELLSLGLKQAKDIVDKAPIVMKKGKKDQGEKLKEELAKSGCVVTLK